MPPRPSDLHDATVSPSERTRALLTSLVPRVRNLTRYLVRSEADVDDLAQEALVAILRGLPSFRGEGALTSWADRVAARSVFASLAQRRRDPSRPGQAAELALVPLASAEPPADDASGRRRAVLALDALPFEQRSCLVFHHVLEMTVPEIAAELGCPAETVRTRLRTGKLKMRQMLGCDAGEGGEGDHG